MADPVHMLLDTAKSRPDPRAVGNWLTAYLGTRPLAAKHTALNTLEAQIKALNPPPDGRVLGLVLRVLQKTRETIVK